MIENKYQLSWISYDEFYDIKEIGRGGFATVYGAYWYDKSQNHNRVVALKLLHKSNNYHKEFIKEVIFIKIIINCIIRYLIFI